MTRLERVIEQVKQYRKHSNGWIYENGEISDKVILGDILVYLESLKDYEINVTDEYIEKFLRNKLTRNYYTYNWNANISNDLSFHILDLGDVKVVAFRVHIGCDARYGFTEWFVCKFEYYELMYEIEGAAQHKWFGENDRYCVNISIFSEIYYVWDSETKTETSHYCLEVENLLRELEELEGCA